MPTTPNLQFNLEMYNVEKKLWIKSITKPKYLARKKKKNYFFIFIFLASYEKISLLNGMFITAPQLIWIV